MDIENNYTTSPHQDNSENKKLLVERFCEQNEISIPPNAHFLTHLNEVNYENLMNLLGEWKNQGCEDGVHTYNVCGGRPNVTRLHGEKMKNDNLSVDKLTRHFIKRGQDRPAQPILLAVTPFQETTLATIVCFGKTLYTIHSGPSMPPSFEDQEWKTNVLLYSPLEDEIFEQLYLQVKGEWLTPQMLTPGALHELARDMCGFISSVNEKNIIISEELPSADILCQMASHNCNLYPKTVFLNTSTPIEVNVLKQCRLNKWDVYTFGTSNKDSLVSLNNLGDILIASKADYLI